MAGAIRTGPVTKAYEEGYERAFIVPQHDADHAWRELAERFTKWAGHPPASCDGAGDREPRVSDPKGSTEPEAEQAAPRTRDLVEQFYASLSEDIDAHAKWHEEHPDEKHLTIEEAAELWDALPERETASAAPAPYSCPTCGWHLAYSSAKCGNATCPRGKTRYTTRS